VLAVLLLCTSRAFIDYSTSGLENPLTHLLVVCFAWSYLVSNGSLFQLSLLSGLLAFNRPDTILVIVPALAHLALRSWVDVGFKKTLRALVLGWSPWLCWLVFSLFYYGFLVPNTAFAKLNTGITQVASVKQGLIYLGHTVAWDPTSILILLAGAFAAVAGVSSRERLFALGALLHLAYVVRIGGDFMAGRFLTMAILVSVCLIARHPGLMSTRTAAAFAVPLVVALFLLKDAESWPTSTDYKLDGIADERAFYRKSASLMASKRGQRMPNHVFVQRGKEMAKKGVKVQVIGPAGYLGFAAGPSVQLLDVWGLVDPLMARLPAQDPKHFRIGHFNRRVPKGYKQTLKTGECKMTRKYCEYYAELERIVRGPIWSFARFGSIIKMNLGVYDHLLASTKKKKA
jgi:arabinofuranosyltransferase